MSDAPLTVKKLLAELDALIGTHQIGLHAEDVVARAAARIRQLERADETVAAPYAATIRELITVAWADPEPDCTVESLLAWLRAQLQPFTADEPAAPRCKWSVADRDGSNAEFCSLSEGHDGRHVFGPPEKSADG